MDGVKQDLASPAARGGRLDRWLSWALAFIGFLVAAPPLIKLLLWRIQDGDGGLIILSLIMGWAFAIVRARKSIERGSGIRLWVLILYIPSFAGLLLAVYLINSSLVLSFVLSLSLLIVGLAKSRSNHLSPIFLMALITAVTMGLSRNYEEKIRNEVNVASMAAQSDFLDLRGRPHLMNGTTLETIEWTLDLTELNNRHVSFWGIVSLALVLSFILRRSLLHTFLLGASAVGVTFLVNIIRTSTVLLMESRFGVLWDEGIHPLWVQTSAVLLALGLLFSADALLKFVLSPVNEGGEVKTKSPIWKRMLKWLWPLWAPLKNGIEGPSRVWLWLLALPIWSLLLPFAFLSITKGSKLQAEGDAVLRTSKLHRSENLVVIDRVDYRPQMDQWRLVGFETEERDELSLWGRYSSIWQVEKDNKTLRVAMDYPFSSWHDVSACYVGTNWKILTQETIDSDKTEGWSMSFTRMETSQGEKAIIFCSHCNHNGTPYETPPTNLLGAFRNRLKPINWMPPYNFFVDVNEGTRYQFQLVHQSNLPITPEFEMEAKAIYEDFREQMRQKIYERGGGAR